MDFDMTSIVTEATNVAPAIMVYGAPGIGKTSFGASAPAPLILTLEEGAEYYAVAKTPKLNSFAEFMAALKAVREKPHDFATVVIDSLTSLEPLVWAETCRVHGQQNIEGKEKNHPFAYGKGYHFALTQWKQILDQLDAIRSERGVTVILIAHEKLERVEVPEVQDYHQISPMLQKTASAAIQRWCKVVAYAGHRISVQSNGEAGWNERSIVKTVGRERVLFVNGTPGRISKNQFGIKDEFIPFPLGGGWDSLLDAITKAQEDHA